MKKHLSALLAIMLCVCCLALAACGGSSSPSSTKADSGSSAAASSKATEEATAEDPSEKFIGTWKLAGAETQGVTLVGDLSSMNVGSAQLVIKDDGTGEMSMDDQKTAFTWEQTGDNTLTLALESQSKNETIDKAPEVIYEDGLLKIAIEANDQSGALLFSTDGKIEGMASLSMDDATAVTSEDELIGSWKISGVSYGGAYMFGDAASLAAINGSEEMVVTFDKDGKATMLGDEAKWSIGDDGAVIEDDSGLSIAVKALGDDILMDVGAAFGMDMVMRFSK